MKCFITIIILLNDSLYLSRTSKAKSRILSTIWLICRTQKNCEPHLHLQFSRCRRPTIITRECSTDTSAEEIIYTGHTDAKSIILHLSGIVPQTDIYTVLCKRLIEFHNETRLFVPSSDAYVDLEDTCAPGQTSRLLFGNKNQIRNETYFYFSI